MHESIASKKRNLAVKRDITPLPGGLITRFGPFGRPTAFLRAEGETARNNQPSNNPRGASRYGAFGRPTGGLCLYFPVYVRVTPLNGSFYITFRGRQSDVSLPIVSRACLDRLDRPSSSIRWPEVKLAMSTVSSVSPLASSAKLGGGERRPTWCTCSSPPPPPTPQHPHRHTLARCTLSNVAIPRLSRRS